MMVQKYRNGRPFEKPFRLAGEINFEKDYRVIFVENFESPSLVETKKRWETVSNSEIMTFSNDVPAGSAGKQSLLMSHVGGKGSGGQFYRRLPPGHLGPPAPGMKYDGSAYPNGAYWQWYRDAPHVGVIAFLLPHLEQDGIYVSAGSACHSKGKPSNHVHAAIGLPEWRGLSAVRFGISWQLNLW